MTIRIKILVLYFIFISPVGAGVKLTWCAYYNWSPWIYPTKKFYDRILIEQLKLFEKTHNIKIKPVIHKNWKRCQIEVEKGNIDILLGANKTPEREKKFYYLDIPAFINRTPISAYTSDNSKLQPVKSWEDLRQYTLVVIRGDRFGSKVDTFVGSLSKHQRFIVNLHDQALRMLVAGRRDYLIAANSSFDTMVQKFIAENPEMSNIKFRKFFSSERATPVYIATTKKGETFTNTKQLWTETIENYYHRVDFDKRVRFHRENAKKYTQ